MNVLITLPKDLLEKIMSGEKKFEMRKSVPRLMNVGEDGFFVVEKGTDEVRCWCRVDKVETHLMSEEFAKQYAKDLCVYQSYIQGYAPVGAKVYLWRIGKVIKFECLSRDSLIVDRNPQQFAYCPLSYGESY